jgi:UDP-GlcNAc:undecaprenyl-phosphate/decaprenyl-phosphate GlcNAc-1-phosphate transferase
VRLAGLALSVVVAAALVGPWLRDMERTGLTRRNYRHRLVAFPAGVVLVACSLVALVPLAVLDDRADLDLLDPELRRWAVYVLGVALLGLLDDALGRGLDAATPRGWRAHAKAVATGHFSAGAIKAVGALGLAAYATSGLGRHDLGYLADLALLLLSTNLFNLLDLRPGRVEKAFAALLFGLCFGTWTVAPLDLLGLFIGPVLVGAAYTLRERAMLGDTGSNLVGALAGISLLVTLDDTGRIVALVIVAALNLYGEFRSISRTIEGIPLLRSLDSLGRLTKVQEADPGR